MNTQIPRGLPTQIAPWSVFGRAALPYTDNSQSGKGYPQESVYSHIVGSLNSMGLQKGFLFKVSASTGWGLPKSLARSSRDPMTSSQSNNFENNRL